MRLKFTFPAVLFVALALTGCATSQASPGPPVSAPATTSNPTASPSDTAVAESGDEHSRAQAQAWFDDISLPQGATPTAPSVVSFNSFTGWPCGPISAIEAFWLVPDATLSDTADWLDENPAGGLLSVWGDRRPVSIDVEGMMLGYIPEEGAQEGIVYTLRTVPEGVAVRAEIAAQTADASCPELPEGTQYGAPGMG